MDEPLRVGLVGCGGMGNEHLKIIAGISHARLVGVCDYREPRARRMSAQHNVPCWLDYEPFLDEARPEAVHICSPSGLHAEQGIAAAERGIHVLCEKPLDIDLAKVDRLIAACDRHNVRLGCIFQRRMSRGAQIVQRAIAEGRMGRVLSCSVSVKWWRSQVYYDKDEWRGTWTLDGGALANQGIHSLDQMVWMAGPVAEVEYAHLETANHRIEAEDFAIAVVRFESGARGTLEVTTCCHPDLATRLEIYGTHGSAALDDARVVRYGLEGQDLLDTLEDRGGLTGGGANPWAISLGGHEAQIQDFYRAVREGRQPLVDGREARPAVDLLTKIYAKAFPNQKIGT
ncbi:MAG TPA: Gfo/Idh/MocA family oxidoreductase [Chthonomonadaceae bacterium]|nr:Gfo/Idh/MocA family oxidoreductase [Chthonomonadaceae bacterium]